MRASLLATCLAVTGLASVIAPAVAMADFPSFGASKLSGLNITADGNPGIVQVLNDPQFFNRTNPCNQWAQLKPQLDRLIEQNLPQVNPKLPKGVSIHDQHSRLSASCEGTYSLSGPYIALNVKIARNILFFKTTTPTVFGSGADPAFSLDYDLTASVTVQVPSTTSQPFFVGPVTLTLANPHWDSQNFTGDLVKAADNVWKFVGGNDFLAPLSQDRSFQFDGFKSGLNQINAQLASLRNRGLPVIRHDYNPQSQILSLRITDPNRSAAADTCAMGFVWREAVPGDHVCVAPGERDRARRQNAEAMLHRAGSGAFGPDTCNPGYVWREVTPADHVCVTPGERQQARLDNSQAASRRDTASNPQVIH